MKHLFILLYIIYLLCFCFQDFILDLEGSQTLRILCYENSPLGPILRGKGALELSQTWLTDKIQDKSVSLQEVGLLLFIFLKAEHNLSI